MRYLKILGNNFYQLTIDKNDYTFSSENIQSAERHADSIDELDENGNPKFKESTK